MTNGTRAALRRLRAGIVPGWALDRLSVGYDEVRNVTDQSLERTLAGKRVDPLFISGEWGSGKTHLLSFIRASARQLGVPCALVTLDATLFSLNHPQRLYAAVAERMVLDQYAGLRGVLIHLLSNPTTRAALSDFAASGIPFDFAYSLNMLCAAAARGEGALIDEEYAWTIPLGLDLSWADYTYKRRAALSRLCVLTKMFSHLGLGGLVALFDEAETLDQLWNIRSRLVAYSTIGSISRNAGLWAIFGITDRFDRTVRFDLDRIPDLSISVDDDAEWFLSRWKRKQIDVLSPPVIERSFAHKVVANISRLYQEAYGLQVDEKVIRTVATEWGTTANQNPRRLMRAAVEAMDHHLPLTLSIRAAAHQAKLDDEVTSALREVPAVGA